MLMNEFCFVQLSTGGTSRRGEELEQAKARSHAAAVTHKRRHLKRRVDKERAVLVNVNQPSTPRPDLLPSKITRLDGCQFPARVTLAARDEEDLSESGTNLYMNDPSYAERVHEQLDPFLKLAGHTTARERNLLQFYLIICPAAVYGIGPDTIHCPVRYTTVQSIQTNEAWLLWTLLSAEISAPGLEDTEKKVRILSRRSQIYRYMNKLISDPATRFSDNTIMGLNFAGLVESRVGSLASARKHLAAVRDLITYRGGIQVLPVEISLPTCCIWSWVGLGSHAFPDIKALEIAMDVFKSNMTGIRQWVPSLLNQFNDGGSKVSRISHTLLARYLLARIRIFSSFSPLYRFVGHSCCGVSEDQARSHVALLWATNQILYESRDDYKQAARFLDALYCYVESADEPCPGDLQMSGKGAKSSGLKTSTVLNFLGRVYELYLSNASSKDAYGIGAPQKEGRSGLRLWETVQVVELVHLLSLKSRKGVLRQLSDWLIGTDSSEDVKVIFEDNLEDLTNEMRRAWFDQNHRRNNRATSIPTD